MARSRHTPAAQGGKWLWPPTRKAIYLRDGHECAYCASTDRLSVDHYVAPQRGGTNHHTNLLTVCLSCNSSKQDRTPRQWWAHLRTRFEPAFVQKRQRRAARLRKKCLKPYRAQIRRQS